VAPPRSFIKKTTLTDERRGRRFLLFLLVTAVASIGAGCASNSSSARPSAVGKAAATKPWCQAKQDAAWKNVRTNHVVALSRRVSVGPIAVADRRSFYAEIHSKRYSGIVKIDARTSRYTKIRPDRYGVVGSADGRWFVWADQINGYGATRAIWAWDSRSGRLRRISGSMRTPNGDWVSASDPAVRHGYVTWSQSTRAGKGTEVHVVDLSTGRDSIIYRGSASEPFLLPDHVVAWTENVSPSSKNPTYVLRAANAVTGKRVALVKGVRNLRGDAVVTLLSDGAGYLYTARPMWGSLWWSPSLNLSARRVFTAAHNNWIDNSLQFAGRYIFFSSWGSGFLVDVASGRYLRLSASVNAVLNDEAIVLEAPNRLKKLNPVSDVTFLPLGSVPPIPACR
jgi:hypothetical protein